MSGKFLYKTPALKQKIYINIEKNVKIDMVRKYSKTF